MKELTPVIFLTYQYMCFVSVPLLWLPFFRLRCRCLVTRERVMPFWVLDASTGGEGPRVAEKHQRPGPGLCVSAGAVVLESGLPYMV